MPFDFPENPRGGGGDGGGGMPDIQVAVAALIHYLSIARPDLEPGHNEMISVDLFIETDSDGSGFIPLGAVAHKWEVIESDNPLYDHAKSLFEEDDDNSSEDFPGDPPPKK